MRRRKLRTRTTEGQITRIGIKMKKNESTIEDGIESECKNGIEKGKRPRTRMKTAMKTRIWR
mgnify:CR=1 FL=1